MKRLLWNAGLLAAAIIVVGVETDRTSRKDMSYLEVVPGPLRSFALEGLVNRAIADGSPADALDEAKELVRKRPIPAENLRALAVVEQAAGDDSGSMQALSLAAGRGWRDPTVQTALVMAGVSSEDWTMAAQRLAASWVVSSDSDLLHRISLQLTNSAQGRAALATVLASNVPANNSILRWSMASLPAEQAGDMAAQAVLQGAHFDCGRLGDLATLLAREGNAPMARRIWSGDCRDAAPSTSAVSTAYVQRPYDAPPGPFDWNLPQTAEIASDISQDAGGLHLEVTNRGRVSFAVASKLLALPPGEYRLALDGRGSGGEAGLGLTVLCLPGKPVLEAKGVLVSSGASVPGPAVGERTVTFTVPAEGCGTQQVVVHAAPGAYRGIMVTMLH